MRPVRRSLLLAPLLAGMLLAGAALADDDQDRARAAVEQGEILPLRTILDRAAADFPGRLLEAKLEDEDRRLVYEVKLLNPAGQVMELVYDARTGALLEVERPGRHRRRNGGER
jgi:uncharacterized membrane protein YkoI